MVNLLWNFIGGSFSDDCFYGRHILSDCGSIRNPTSSILENKSSTVTGGSFSPIVNIPKLKKRVTFIEDLGANAEIELPSVDGRKTDHSILKYANIKNPKSECLNGADICTPADTLSIISYFVKKKAEIHPKKYKYRGTFKEDLKEAKKILNCPTESCVITSDEFVDLVTSENIMSKDQIKRDLNFYFKPINDISNNPQTGTSSSSIAHVLRYWGTLYPDFTPILPKEGIVDVKDMPLNNFLSTFNLINHLELQPECKRLGFVFNNVIFDLKMGHAVCIYIDLTSISGAWTIEYYNSHGVIADEYISTWLTKTTELLRIYRMNKYNNDNVKAIIVLNITIQGNSYECALHSLFYLKTRLEGVPYTFHRKNIIPSSAMIQFRKYIFRNNEYDLH